MIGSIILLGIVLFGIYQVRKSYPYRTQDQSTGNLQLELRDRIEKAAEANKDEPKDDNQAVS